LKAKTSTSPSQFPVQVWIPRPVFQTYTYLVPSRWRDFVFPGSRVQLSFGRQSLTGIVKSLEKPEDFESIGPSRLKEIEQLLEGFSFLSPSQIQLIEWMSEYYLVGAGEVAGLFTPSYKPPLEKKYRLKEKELQLILENIPRRRRKFRQSLMRISLMEGGPFPKEEILEQSQLSAPLFRECIKEGYLEESLQWQGVSKVESSVSNGKNLVEWELFPKLTQTQQEALDQLLETEGKQHYYLRGVTGSGKTEVYMHLIARALEKGKSVLFLVPEISLTPQFIKVFENRFPGNVAVHHSRLTEKEKYQYWCGMRSGEKKIVIGARSALFAPLQDIDWIILDEEGEGSYKQETSPYYDARRVAVEMARLRDCNLVFGSATPSLESYHHMQSGDIHRIEMRKRVNERELPGIELCDLRTDFQKSNRSIFSRHLKEELQGVFDRGEQALLFVHRRGHSSFVMCRSCSFILNCPHCEISLTFHDSGKLNCHYCSYSRPMPKECPSCKSLAIKYFGLGTQKAQAFFSKEFPGISCERLDTDVTRKKGAMEAVLQRFGNGETQALIGTQLIAKGLDFANVTLVGVLNPDALVKMGDYTAHERAFQLFVQIAGRSGRAQKKGKMVMQTYLPDHPLYQRVQSYELEEFLKEELGLRYQLSFPPFSRLIHIQSSGKDKIRARHNLEKFYEVLTELKSDPSVIELSGVQESPIARLEGRYRFRCILKARYNQELWAKLKRLKMEFRSLQSTRLKILVDAENLL